LLSASLVNPLASSSPGVIAMIDDNNHNHPAIQIHLDDDEGPQENGSIFKINSNRFSDKGSPTLFTVEKEGRSFQISTMGCFPENCLYTAWSDKNTENNRLWTFTCGGYTVPKYSPDDIDVPSNPVEIYIQEIFNDQN
jgi:hypothetical protein